MFDFLLQIVKNNLEISILLFFLFIGVNLFFTVKHNYIHEKIKGWIYIILFILLFFISKITLIFGLIILFFLSFFEFYQVLTKIKNFSKISKIFFGFIFFLLLSALIFLIYFNPEKILYLFIIISFSDIIAYFVGKNIPFKKGFTKLSPNKSLSGVIAQIIFVFLALFIFKDFFSFNIFQIFFISIFTSFGDLTESYFKRKAGIKDMADYIPGHGGVLDRIDSIFFSGAFLGICLLFLKFI